MKDVKDLLDDSNYNFLSCTVFITKYNKKTNHLDYYKVLSALKHFRESLQKDLSDFGQKKDFLTSEKPEKVAC